MTIHLIYPHKNRISAPDVIGYKTNEELKQYFDVITYDWDSIKTITPNDGDILIGHAHPLPFTIFRKSVQLEGWKRKILMQPYNADISQVGYVDDVIDHCDAFLAITGDYWFRNIKNSSTHRWLPKMKQLNLAVDKTQFPRVKKEFNKVGSRKFIYIGNDHPGKNLSYLSSIARELSEHEFAWAGRGGSYQGLKKLGHIDFSTEEGRQIIANYDFMITVGNADANPTTILEALSWGLIPICTETSGYSNELGILNIPNDDVKSACTILLNLQQIDNSVLENLTKAGNILLETKYNWPRFFSDVISCIKSEESNSITPRVSNKIHYPTMNTLKITGKLLVNNTLKVLKR